MHSSYSPPSKKSKQSTLKTTEITKTLSRPEKNGKMKLAFLKKTPGGRNEWYNSEGVQLKGKQKPGIPHLARVFYNNIGTDC